MRALVKLYRDEGTLIYEQMFQRLELGGEHEINLHQISGPIIENGMAIYAITIQADVRPVQ